MDNRMMDGTKLIWHTDKIKAHYCGARVAPIHLDIGIAKFCNVKCVFCYGKHQVMSPVYIERNPLMNILRDAAEIGVKSIAFIGDGEPTCNPNLYEALALGKNLGLDMAISTNAVLINTEEKAKSVLDSCVWMRVCLSAGTKEGYQKIHGVDKFNTVCDNIRLLVETKRKYGLDCDIGLQSVYVPGLMDADMIEESALAINTGVDYFVIKQCSLPDNGESGMEMFDINAYDSNKTIDVLKACEGMSTDETKIIPKWKTIKQKGKRPYFGCLAVPFISEISGNGNWYPCGYFFNGDKRFDDIKFGNLQTERMRDIFYSQRYTDILKKMRTFDVHKDCRGACRLDKCNEFVYQYINPPKGVNFI